MVPGFCRPPEEPMTREKKGREGRPNKTKTNRPLPVQQEE